MSIDSRRHGSHAFSEAEASDLSELGYEQQLARNIGGYASFAAGFSFVSILTTVFQLFGFGFSFAGPGFFWTWPAVFLGQLLVALQFAELAARWPISGAIYQWSTRLGGRIWGWTAGWLMLLAQVVTVAAAAIALQAVLPVLWSGFQLVGGDPSLSSKTGSTNAALLGIILLLVTTTINAIGVRIMAVINSCGVTCEIVGVILLVVALFTRAERGPGVVLDTGGLGGSGYAGALIVSGLMAGYVLVGFDSAAELSEETRDARGTAPRTIIRALTFSGLFGALLLLAALMASPSVSVDSEVSTGGLPYIVTSRLGELLGKIFIADVALAASVCTLAIQTATTRMVFSMARDRVLPFSRALSSVSPRTATPILPAVVVGVLAICVLVLNIFQPSMYTALASVCIMLLYIAYLMVTLPLLRRRLQGWPAVGAPQAKTAEGKELFSLGRWGIPLNLLAVLWGIGMTINLAWPRDAIYNPVGDPHWYLKWFALVFLVGALVAGALAYWRQRVENQRVLDSLDPDRPGSDRSTTVPS
jgi:urea carboxylase system permease